VAGGFVYAGDLDGVIHAINFNDGVSAWTFDLRRELHVPAPGMIYGGPVVQGRHLFVATCHAQGAVNQPSMVVCVGDP
jgi:hypothetical protein